VFSVFGALAAMALQSVKWFALGGAIAGLVFGVVGAFVLVDRFNQSLVNAKQPSYVRKFGTCCCVLWALLLPTSLATAGLIWGLGHGVGNVIEGPVSTTIRSTAHGWLNEANEVRTKLLGHWTLTKRLSETELSLVTQTAPRWLADVLFPHDAPAPWLKLTGITIPPTVVAMVREGLREAPTKHPSWFSPVIASLRSRSQGPAANHPTMQETLEAMIAPPVFENAARAVRSYAVSYVKKLVVVGLGVSALLAVILWALWKKDLVKAKEAS
jgi:hypothetical protein